MTDITMKERLARALCIKAGEHPDTPTPCHPTVKLLWQHHLPAVETVLDAIREPNDAMKLASKRYKRGAKVYSGPECYRQMIDAAKNEDAT